MRSLMLVLLTALPLFAVAETATNNDAIQYSHDARYVYAKTAYALTWDQEQIQAVSQAQTQIAAHLTALQSVNPRIGGAKGQLISAIQSNIPAFERGLDDIVGLMQKYFSTAKPYGLRRWKALPSAFVLFTGIEVRGGLGLSGGGSVMLGMVFMPVHVHRTEIDTNKVEEYFEFDTNLILWPTANVGAGFGGGGNYRGGLGLVWGSLTNAKDLKGLVGGASVTGDLGMGINGKILLLKNWSRPGTINNTLVTFGVDIGPSAGLDAHANISWIFDAEGWLKAAGGIMPH